MIIAVAYYSVGFFEKLVDVVYVVAPCRRTSLALLQELIEGWGEVRHFPDASPILVGPEPMLSLTTVSS
jgi:hypothetical protein